MKIGDVEHESQSVLRIMVVSIIMVEFQYYASMKLREGLPQDNTNKNLYLYHMSNGFGYVNGPSRKEILIFFFKWVHLKGVYESNGAVEIAPPNA